MSRHFKKIKDIIKYNSTKTDEILHNIDKFENEELIAIYNPECLGIMNSTKDLFKNTVAIGEVLHDRVSQEICDNILKNNIKQVIFSSITFGWKSIIEKLREKNDSIIIKFLWHGNHSLFVMRDEPYFLYSIIELLDRNIINGIGFSKKSMAEFYLEKGYNSYFVPNNTHDLKLENKIEFPRENEKTYVGLYSAGDRWEKNTFNQLSAVSIIKKLVVDILPVTSLVASFCDTMGIEIRQKDLGYMPRQELLNRMSQNDINLYVTFSECSPVLPLESLDLGVPCITGNNHHYFAGSKLEDYLVVKSEDNIDEIAKRIKICIDNKAEIIDLYNDWKKEYNKYCQEKLQQYIEG